MHAPGGSPAVEHAAPSSGSAAPATAFVELAAAAPGREPAAAAPAERLPATTTAAAGREPAAASAAVAVVRAAGRRGAGVPPTEGLTRE